MTAKRGYFYHIFGSLIDKFLTILRFYRKGGIEGVSILKEYTLMPRVLNEKIKKIKMFLYLVPMATKVATK